MTEEALFDVLRQALWATVLMASPLLAVALVVGVVIGLLQALIGWHGRGEYEQVLSGPGLMNIHRYVHGETPCAALDLEGKLPRALEALIPADIVNLAPG